jgi:hypothetical protein
MIRSSTGLDIWLLLFADRVCGRGILGGSIWRGIFRVSEKGLPISGKEMIV